METLTRNDEEKLQKQPYVLKQRTSDAVCLLLGSRSVWTEGLVLGMGAV